MQTAGNIPINRNLRLVIGTGYKILNRKYKDRAGRNIKYQIENIKDRAGRNGIFRQIRIYVYGVFE